MKERNDNMIYIWRIIFANMIAFFHFDNVYNISKEMGILNGWYISVEFFSLYQDFCCTDSVKVINMLPT